MSFFGMDDDELNFGVMPMGSMQWQDKNSTKQMAQVMEQVAEQATSTPSEQETQFAPGTEIPYDPNFPGYLRAQNATLTGLLDSLADTSHKKAYNQLTAALEEFIGLLEQRFLEQNVRLFVYLSKCLKDDGQLALVKEMKREMGQLSRKIRQFGRHYLEESVNGTTVAGFREELTIVDAALKDRLQRESDSLYDLYLAPDRY